VVCNPGFLQLLKGLPCLLERSLEVIQMLLHPSRWSLWHLLLLSFPQVGITRIQEARSNGSSLWLKLPHNCKRYFCMLSNSGDQGPLRRCNAFIRESNRHHRGSDQGVIVDGSLGQKGIETASPLHGDCCVANHRVHSAGQDVVTFLLKLLIWKLPSPSVSIW
jgi:hypothetical protein